VPGVVIIGIKTNPFGLRVSVERIGSERSFSQNMRFNKGDRKHLLNGCVSAVTTLQGIPVKTGDEGRRKLLDGFTVKVDMRLVFFRTHPLILRTWLGWSRDGLWYGPSSYSPEDGILL
jgi:hypothetical protein